MTGKVYNASNGTLTKQKQPGYNTFFTRKCKNEIKPRNSIVLNVLYFVTVFNIYVYSAFIILNEKRYDKVIHIRGCPAEINLFILCILFCEEFIAQN